MSVQAGKGVLPYGSWPTPITSEVVVAEAVRLAGLAVDGPDVIWSEGRPAEGGRSALVRRSPDGALTELLPEDQNARTAVHEYGGGAWWAHNGVVWFASWRDQRIYRRDPVEVSGVLLPHVRDRHPRAALQVDVEPRQFAVGLERG